jgi:hypothetical protein
MVLKIQFDLYFNLNTCVQVCIFFGILIMIKKPQLGLDFNLNMCAQVCKSFANLV